MFQFHVWRFDGNLSRPPGSLPIIFQGTLTDKRVWIRVGNSITVNKEVYKINSDKGSKNQKLNPDFDPLISQGSLKYYGKILWIPAKVSLDPPGMEMEKKRISAYQFKKW